MRPKPDASIYYRNQSIIDRKESERQRIANAQAAIRAKLGIDKGNRYEKTTMVDNKL